MDKQNFARLKEMTDKELVINVDNVMEKSLSLPNTYQKYLKIYIVELRKFKEIKSKVKWKYGKLYHHYSWDVDFKLDKKNEIEAEINGNDEYYDLVKLLDDQTIVVDFIEKFLDQLKTAGFAIKNYLEILKLKQGVGL